MDIRHDCNNVFGGNELEVLDGVKVEYGARLKYGMEKNITGRSLLASRYSKTSVSSSRRLSVTFGSVYLPEFLGHGSGQQSC